MKAILKICALDNKIRQCLLRGIAWIFMLKICEVIPDIIICLIINLVILKENSFFGHLGLASNMPTICMLVSFILLAFIINTCSQFFSTLEFKRAARIIQYRLKMYLYTQVLSNKNYTNMTYHQTSEAIDTVEFFIERTVLDIFSIIFSGLIIGTILCFIGLNFLIYVIMPMPIVFILAAFLQVKLNSYREYIKQAKRELRHEVDELVNARAVIREFNKVEKKALHLNQVHDDASYLISAVSPLTRIFIYLAFIAILLHGISMVFHHQITMGTFAATIFLSRKFLHPFSFLGVLLDNYKTGIKAYQEINTHLEQI